MTLSQEYTSILGQRSETSKSKQDQLIILDLNGTLCDRGRSKVTFYTRPHSKKFFDYIFSNYTVMVWSSAQAHSVKRMCKMFEPHVPGLTWDRSHFNLSTEDFYSNMETLKDLDQVWKISDDFNAKNTIILDDTSRKLISQPHNLMLMSTFNHTSFEQDNDLLRAMTYLKNLRYQTNVASYMWKNPFDFTLKYGIEPDPVGDRYVGHYIQGVWNNPPSKVLKTKKLNKKQKKRKAAELELQQSKSMSLNKNYVKFEDPPVSSILATSEVEPLSDKKTPEKSKKKSKKNKKQKTR